MSIRLVQISDLHLGRSFGGLGLPDDVRDLLTKASMGAIERACDLVRRRDAVALLVPGDLFDRPEVDEELVGRVQAIFGQLERPVLVSPGNHDAYGPMSAWNNAALEKLGLSPWPENVYIFASWQLTAHRLLDGQLAVHGHRVEGYHSASDSPLTTFELAPDARWNVLLIHGALEGERFSRRTTMPFTARQLADIGADYVAVGHYHRTIRIEHDGRLLGAYAGVPVPGELDEDPHGGLLVVTLQDGEPEVETVETYPGRIAKLVVEADPPFLNSDDVCERSLAMAKREDLHGDDIIFLRLTGFSEQQLDPEAIESQLQPDFLHIAVSDETEPETSSHSVTSDGRVTVESQFVAHLQEQIEQCGDTEQRAVLESALRYGMRALRGRVVRPPAAIDPSEEAEPYDAD